jgi:putative membrane protein
MRPSIHGRFGLATPEQAAIVRSFAYNQGFYSRFLAIGVGIGLGPVTMGTTEAGRALVLLATGSMVAAGTVLVLHNGRFLRAAAIQVVPALVAILATWVLG